VRPGLLNKRKKLKELNDERKLVKDILGGPIRELERQEENATIICGLCNNSRTEARPFSIHDMKECTPL
jgi:hypothetical protein